MATRSASNVSIRPMQRTDLEEARRIFRVAFGTFIGVPEPEAFWADRECVFTRWQTDPQAALVAEVDGKLAGSNIATNWGSFGFFGPLTILPEFWDGGIGQKLLGRTIDLLAKWGVLESWTIHVCTQSQTHRPIPEVRILAQVPYSHHVQEYGGS